MKANLKSFNKSMEIHTNTQIPNLKSLLIAFATDNTEYINIRILKQTDQIETLCLVVMHLSDAFIIFIIMLTFDSFNGSFYCFKKKEKSLLAHGHHLNS